MGCCTAVTCIDGRVILPVIDYLKKRFRVEYVDVVTEPGPNRILAHMASFTQMDSIFSRVAISVERHRSVGIAVVGHHDCSGNPADRERQLDDTRAAIARLRARYRELPVLGLWVDDHWRVSEVAETP